MAQKELGYVEMEWTCPRCGTNNPGTQKLCRACGGPQPGDVQFHQRPNEEVITGAAADAIAALKPDIHCGFCGARNSWDAVTCKQCGADLKSGLRRETGIVSGGLIQGAANVNCPNCGQANPANNLNCSNCGAALGNRPEVPVAPSMSAPPVNKNLVILAVILIILGLAACFFFTSQASKTEPVGASVQGTNWYTTVPVEMLQLVQLQGWESDIPNNANVMGCEYRYAYTSNNPQPVSTEVCGTPYTIDQGTGYAKVVQDCSYETYAKYCAYQTNQWVVVDRLVQQGSDLNPVLAQRALDQNQRYGQADARYQIQFQTASGLKVFETNDINLFQQARSGSKWTLQVNRAGNIVSAVPEN